MEIPIYKYKNKRKSNSWARWMVRRTMRKNQNNLCSVVGKTGSGKTYSAISICQKMSELDGVPFTIDHIVFSLRELMDLINSGGLKRGSKIIFDEPQVSIGSRDFQSEANKVFNFLISTFRHRNLSLFFCTPFETLLDKNTRKMFHVRLETVSINRKKRRCVLKPFFIEYSDFKADAYKKRLTIFYTNKDGSRRNEKIDFWSVREPSADIIELYEKKKLAFTERLNRNITERLKKFDESGKSITAEKKDDFDESDLKLILTAKQAQVMEAINSGGSKTDEQCAEYINMNSKTFSAHKRAAIKKILKHKK